MSAISDGPGDAAVAMIARRRLPVWRFLLVAVPLAWVFCVMVAGLLGRFQLEIDPQVALCLPGHRFFVVDRAQHVVRRGDIVVFAADDQMPKWPRGSDLAKMVVGLPGDRVHVTPEVTEVNGVAVGRGLLAEDTVGVPQSALVRDLVVPRGTVWVMGATADSYDSRYYGPVPLSLMRGVARALL